MWGAALNCARSGRWGQGNDALFPDLMSRSSHAAIATRSPIRASAIPSGGAGVTARPDLPNAIQPVLASLRIGAGRISTALNSACTSLSRACLPRR